MPISLGGAVTDTQAVVGGQSEHTLASLELSTWPVRLPLAASGHA